jgi:electron transfer flavoprotein alpha subunit
MFLRPRTAGSLQAFVFRRAYSTAPSPHALVFLEHRQGVIDSASLSALTAAEQLGGQVTGLVVGGPDHVPGVVEKAKK